MMSSMRTVETIISCACCEAMSPEGFITTLLQAHSRARGESSSPRRASKGIMRFVLSWVESSLQLYRNDSDKNIGQIVSPSPRSHYWTNRHGVVHDGSKPANTVRALIK